MDFETYKDIKLNLADEFSARRLPKISAIYGLQHWSDKIYIGSSTHYIRRLYHHKRKLIKNTHWNTNIISLYEKDGLESFTGILLEFCEKENFLERENYWINLYRPFLLNMDPHADRTYHNPTKETRRKMSVSLTRRMSDPEERKRVALAVSKLHQNGIYEHAKEIKRGRKLVNGKYVRINL